MIGTPSRFTAETVGPVGGDDLDGVLAAVVLRASAAPAATSSALSSARTTSDR